MNPRLLLTERPSIVSSIMNTSSRPDLPTLPLKMNQAIGLKDVAMGKFKVQSETTMSQRENSLQPSTRRS